MNKQRRTERILKDIEVLIKENYDIQADPLLERSRRDIKKYLALTGY
jgi:hypothetical protein